MAGPWDKYASQQSAPWAKYSQQPAPEAPQSEWTDSSALPDMSPQGAGSDWLQRAMAQNIAGVQRGTQTLRQAAVLPYLNVGAHLGVPGAAKLAQQYQQTTPASAQIAGGLLSTAPLAGIGGELAGLPASALGRVAANVGTGAAIGGLTSPKGQGVPGAVVGGALGGAGSAVGEAWRAMHPGIATPELSQEAKDFLKKYGQIGPNPNTGQSEFLQQATGWSRGGAAKSVTDKLVSSFRDAMGLPAGKTMRPADWQIAKEGAYGRVQDAFKGATVKIDPAVRGDLVSLLKSRPLDAEEPITGIPNILSSIRSGKLDGEDYLSLERALNTSYAKARNANNFEAANAYKNMRDQLRGTMPSNLRAAFDRYKSEYGLASAFQDALGTDPAAFSGAGVNMPKVINSYTNYVGKGSLAKPNSDVTKAFRDVLQFNTGKLTPGAGKDVTDVGKLAARTAHTIASPASVAGYLGKGASFLGLGQGLRAYYASPEGQRALIDGLQRGDPATQRLVGLYPQLLSTVGSSVARPALQQTLPQ